MSANPSPASPTRYAWFVVALLVPVALLNYLDRQMLAAMKFSVMQDIPDIALEAKWGTILALFKWVYAFLSPVGGYLADRYSRRHVIAGSLFVWSLVTWTTGHVSTYEQRCPPVRSCHHRGLHIPAARRSSRISIREHSVRAVGAPDGIYVGVIIGVRGYVAIAGTDARASVCGIPGTCTAAAILLCASPRPQMRQGAQRIPGGALRELSALVGLLLVLYFTLPALAAGCAR